LNIPTTINHHRIITPIAQIGQGQNFNRERPDTDDSRHQTHTRNNRPPADFVFRGELLEAADRQRHFQPRFNQQISTQNKFAIESYLSSNNLTIDDDPRGRLLDQFV